MKLIATQTALTHARSERRLPDKSFAIDTTFVLFFLAVQLGMVFGSSFFETLFLGCTLVAVTIFPYFTVTGEKPEFGRWVCSRSLILIFAFLIGIAFSQPIGAAVLPGEFVFLPMTLLIASAALSCYIQFYGFFKLRLTN